MMSIFLNFQNWLILIDFNLFELISEKSILKIGLKKVKIKKFYFFQFMDLYKIFINFSALFLFLCSLYFHAACFNNQVFSLIFDFTKDLLKWSFELLIIKKSIMESIKIDYSKTKLASLSQIQVYASWKFQFKNPTPMSSSYFDLFYVNFWNLTHKMRNKEHFYGLLYV